MNFDPTSAALGALVALSVVSMIAAPALASLNRLLARTRETLRAASEEIQAQQDDIDSLFEITPTRLPNGRFAKRQ